MSRYQMIDRWVYDMIIGLVGGTYINMITLLFKANIDFYDWAALSFIIIFARLVVNLPRPKWPRLDNLIYDHIARFDQKLVTLTNWTFD